MSTLSTDPFACFAYLRRGDVGPGWLARAISEDWRIDTSRLFVSLLALSENATFRVDVDGEPVAAVRVHRPGYVDLGQISSELEWIGALASETTVPVPRVLPWSDGSTVLTVQGPAPTATGKDAESRTAPYVLVATAFIPGGMLEDVDDPRPYYRRIGEIAATFHRHTAGWERPENFDRFTWNLDDMVGPGSRWGDWRDAAVSSDDRDVMERAEAAAREELGPLVEGPGARSLIHADLRPSNLLVEGDRLTVIDFDDCGWSYLLYDFAAALSFLEHEDFAPELATEWIAGYSAVRPLGASDIRDGCALSMLRRLQLLGWCTTHRDDALPADLWAAMVPGTADVARKYLASPTWLVDQ